MAELPSDVLLLTREQAAALCQVGENKIDEWSYQKGFPVLRGPRFVRIHREELNRWLAARAVESNPAPPVPRARPPIPALLDNGRRARR